MKHRHHGIAAALLLLTLLYDFYLWGGLARTPTLGPLMVEAAKREVALVGLYLPAGRWLVDAAGLSASAASFAESSFASVESHVLANPAAAMDTVVSGMPTSASIAYYGAPVLVVVSLILWWRRPRVIHSVGKKRR